MTESTSPEDRLRKYKEFISGLRVTNESESTGRSTTTNSTASEPKKPPMNKELITALAVLKQTETPKKPALRKEQVMRKNVMLRIKERSIESSLISIRDERKLLERRLEKGEITQDEYQAEIQKLVRKGKSLLKEKSVVDEKLKAA